MAFLTDARNKFLGALIGMGIGAHRMVEMKTYAEQDRLDSAMAHEALFEMGLEQGGSTSVSTTKRTKEGLADLELSFEDLGWRDMTTYFGIWRFNRSTMRRITALSRIMYMVNPLIKRAVTVQELYVWGSGCTIKAEHPAVNEVLNDFFDNPNNQKVVGQGEEGWTQREREQRIDGNTFFSFFTNKRTGAVRVRLLPFDVVEDIIYNPHDSKEVWFYRRSTANLAGAAIDTDLSGAVSAIPTSTPGTAVLYPDVNFNPKSRPVVFGATGTKIDWDVRVLHVKTGGMSTMKFGMPELYAGLNWATAYKKILENFATILNAYARLAMKITGLPGKAGLAAARSRLNTSVNAGNLRDNNPPPNTASWMSMSGGVDVSPVKTANSTTGPDEARALRSMVASAADLPEHFFGDSDVGNFATSETLDRPTELKMIGRQNMWRQVILTMSNLVIEYSALASEGKLRDAGFKAQIVDDDFTNTLQDVEIIPPRSRKLKSPLRVTVTFPNITERAVADRVRAVVNAATLNGRKAEGIIPDRKFLFKLLLDSLGITDADELTEKYYPDSVLQGFIDPADEAKNDKMEATGKLDAGVAALITAEKPEPAPAPKAPAAPVKPTAGAQK